MYELETCARWNLIQVPSVKAVEMSTVEWSQLYGQPQRGRCISSAVAGIVVPALYLQLPVLIFCCAQATTGSNAVSVWLHDESILGVYDASLSFSFSL